MEGGPHGAFDRDVYDMRWLAITVGIVVAASIATFARYESLHPCDWLQHDMASATALPAPVVQARIRAAFLLRGITTPDATECLTEWWDLKAEVVAQD